MHVTGRAGNQISQIGDLIGGSVGRSVGSLAGKPFDQKLDINGSVTITTKPVLTPNWRIEPNLAAKVALADRTINISGVKLDMLKEVKPYLDRTVNEEMAKLQAQLRNAQHGADGAARMGEDVPFDLDRRGGTEHARAVDRGKADTRGCGTA